MTDGDAVRPGTDDRQPGGSPRAATATVVTAHSSSPDRTVFTERGNADAWIASSLTIEPVE